MAYREVSRVEIAEVVRRWQFGISQRGISTRHSPYWESSGSRGSPIEIMEGKCKIEGGRASDAREGCRVVEVTPLSWVVAVSLGSGGGDV